MSSPARIAAILAAGFLAAFYVGVLWLARHPEVDPLYRLYYIEKRLKFWNHGEGIDYVPGERLVFNEMLPYFTRLGWFFPEDWGTRSDGPASELLLRPRGDAPLREAVVEGQAFFLPGEGGIERQTVSLYVNGRFAGAHTLESPEPAVLRFPLPAQAGGADNLLALRFTYSNSASSKELGLGTDSRQPGFGLIALTLR